MATPQQTQGESAALTSVANTKSIEEGEVEVPKRECKCLGCARREAKKLARGQKWLSEHLRRAVAEMDSVETRGE